MLTPMNLYLHKKLNIHNSQFFIPYDDAYYNALFTSVHASNCIAHEMIHRIGYRDSKYLHMYVYMRLYTIPLPNIHIAYIK